MLSKLRNVSHGSPPLHGVASDKPSLRLPSVSRLFSERAGL